MCLPKGQEIRQSRQSITTTTRRIQLLRHHQRLSVPETAAHGMEKDVSEVGRRNAIKSLLTKTKLFMQI